MAYFLSPVLNEQQFDANGDPRNGALITTYLAGTLTAVATYKTSTGTAHANPIQLNSEGYYPNGTQLWLLGGLTYKFVITDSNGANSRTYDNISGIGDNAATADEWVLFTAAPTYISATSFSVVGDQTNIFQALRRLKSTNTGGTVYSTIVSSTFLAGVTTIVVSNTSGVLDSGLSAVSYGILAAVNPSIPETTIGTALRTAATAAAVRAASGTEAGIEVIGAVAAANALTITINPTSVNFRSATAGSGTVTTVTNAAAATVVISSGSTLGSTNAVLTRVAVLAINNAGTLEAAAVNVVGGMNLDETGFITTIAEGGAGGADSARVIYSTTARANVAYRVMGYIEYTQAVAGTYATQPSLIQGAGGESLHTFGLNGTGTAPFFGFRAKATFDGTTAGTNAPTAGGNITSITRNGAGDYTANFTIAMPDTNYCISGSCTGSTTSGLALMLAAAGAGSAPTLKSTTQVRFYTGNTVSVVDCKEINLFVG